MKQMSKLLKKTGAFQHKPIEPAEQVITSSSNQSIDLKIVVIGDLAAEHAEYRKAVLLNNFIKRDNSNSVFSDGEYNVSFTAHRSTVRLNLKDVSQHTNPEILKFLCENANIVMIAYVNFNEAYIIKLLDSVKDVLAKNPTIVLVGLAQQEKYIGDYDTHETKSLSHQEKAETFAQKKGWLHQVVTLNDIPAVKELFHNAIDRQLTSTSIDADTKIDLFDVVDTGISSSYVFKK